ncbi:MAG: hypothetical protein ABI968_04250 [Acidobacteriota bacterium]
MKPVSRIIPILCTLLVVGFAPALLAEDGHHGCSARSVAGAFGYVTTGIRNGVGPVAGAGQLTFHSDGTISDGKQTVSFNGVIADETFSGTFTVNADCSGSFTVDVASPIAPRTSHVNIVWTGDSNSAKAIFTDPDTILTADAKRISLRD